MFCKIFFGNKLDLFPATCSIIKYIFIDSAPILRYFNIFLGFALFVNLFVQIWGFIFISILWLLRHLNERHFTERIMQDFAPPPMPQYIYK